MKAYKLLRLAASAVRFKPRCIDRFPNSLLRSWIVQLEGDLRGSRDEEDSNTQSARDARCGEQWHTPDMTR
jgi:hypothetical protein